jgi:hypothetical protein
MGYVGTGKFVCETCKGRLRTRDELARHNETPLHKIEIVREEINKILTSLELALTEGAWDA